MFQGNVAVPNLSEVDWDDDKDRVPDKVRKGFPEVGEEIKASFSKNAPDRKNAGRTCTWLCCYIETAVLSTPARNRAAQRIDETDLFAGKTMVPSESLQPA
jgi:hypothetical protein